jgi:glycosyltransferase involved in cell wall biosynthesis
VDTLIQATPPGLPLKLAGRPYHPDYHRHLESLALGKSVEFITTADDATLRDLYRHAWVNVLPSVYQDGFGGQYLIPELMGLTLLEAMACGTPAVCTRVGGMPEFIEEGKTGFVADSPADLSRILGRLASSPELVERIGGEARRVVVERFDRVAVGARLLAIYRSMMAARRVEAEAA